VQRQTADDAAMKVASAAPRKGKTMKRHFYLLSLGVGAMILATGHAFAQSRNCGAREMVIERLASSYGESRQSIGLGPNNQVVEVFASLETGTWTITVTTPQGLTCLVASGQSFERYTEADVEQTDPAL
jgi:hypothetical protein